MSQSSLDKTILHVDANNFYASCECAKDPALRGKPMAVCGDPTRRKGIILAKSYEAKRYDIKTGDTVYQALSKCPNLRIDTHQDNKVMQHVVEKHGFTRRGIIYIADGSPRIAYERT